MHPDQRASHRRRKQTGQPAPLTARRDTHGQAPGANTCARRHCTRLHGRTHLRDHELAQVLHGQTTSQHALHRGEPGVHPAVDDTVVDEPAQLALRQQGVLEVQPRKLDDVDLAQTQRGLDPLELGVTVLVLEGAHSVRHSLNAVYNRAREVVRGIRLVPAASAKTQHSKSST
jgi:hypothetical protein